jgi:hypothetical protein
LSLAGILGRNRICRRVQQMLTGFFCLGLNDIQIKMLVGAINFNRATSFAGLLIRKDLVSLVDLLSR